MKMPIGDGRVVARFCIGSVRLELFTWGYGWWRCSIKILTGHGTDSSVCINGYWGENHLIVEKITDDIITGDWRGCSTVIGSVKFIPFMVL